MIRATVPDQQSLRRASETSSSRMSCAMSPSRSKGSKQSRPSLMAADVTGRSLPANTSNKSRFEAGCNGESDKLAWAGVCALAQRLTRYGAQKARLESGQLPLAHAMVIGATARLVAPADLAPFLGSAPLCLGLWRRRGSFQLPLAFLGGA